eukprot:scaffold171013_cov52-Prasinocladus_malaysianus.AAC.1
MESSANGGINSSHCEVRSACNINSCIHASEMLSTAIAASKAAQHVRPQDGRHSMLWRVVACAHYITHSPVLIVDASAVENEMSSISPGTDHSELRSRLTVLEA